MAVVKQFAGWLKPGTSWGTRIAEEAKKERELIVFSAPKRAITDTQMVAEIQAVIEKYEKK